MTVTMINSWRKIMVNPETLEIKSDRCEDVKYDINCMYLVEEDGEIRFDESYDIDPIKDVKKGDIVIVSHRINDKRYAVVIRDEAFASFIHNIQDAKKAAEDKRQKDTDAEVSSPSC